MGIKSSNVNKKLNFAISCMVSLLAVGCGESLKPLSAKPNTWQESLQNTWDGIFANRPQNRTHFIALYQLKNPALLEALDDGKVNPALAQKIEEEQNAFIAAAKKLSGDVQVLYRYRLVLNAVALMAPNGISKNLGLLDLAQQMEVSGSFARPQEIAGDGAIPNELQLRNSVKFIGADIAHEMGVRGQGMKVGIIDTGIDYTHAMFGGPGTEAAYKSVDPNAGNALFPNQKILGGIDLVGTEYNSDSDNFALRVPKPDLNPLDEAGHGTHVAGTVAGVGDGSSTYSGVAPDASLYAIKVFGADGSTSDEVVIAGLEFAADPSGDLNLSDRLDVVNLSLGSPYGTGHIFYARAVRNMSRAGTVVVASAGNSGAKQYIVGAPSVAEDAISVAASVDNADHNWKFSASEFTAVATGEKFITEAVESPIAKPIVEVGDLKGTLVFAGLANADFTPELAAALQGNVALIDRGAVTFAEKMKRAEAAGAIGVVVVNNQDGAPFAMGGDGEIKIPAIMIAKALGTQLKNEMAKDEVVIQFKTEARIEKPQLIDTLTDFSSQGPRSLDSLIKPEISSPGMNVISAKMGGGSQGMSMSGTSMAGPHVAGVMALLKQTHPQLNSQELKSLLMGTSVTIQDEEKSRYPISRQGAGRVQIDRALHGVLISSKPSLSLGEVSLDQRKVIEKEFSLKNISGKGLQLSLRWDGSANVKVLTRQVSLPANLEELPLKIAFSLSSEGLKEDINQLDGWIKLYEGTTEVHRIPVLAMVRLVSQLQVKKLAIDSTSAIDAFASPAHLHLVNQSSQAAKVLLFNSLGVDPRKTGVVDSARSRACDLQAAGYRFSGGKLQVAVKTYEPLTTWNTCEISIQLDMNNDGVADQELVGVPADHLAGMVGSDPKSILLDAGMTREIRKEYEAQVMGGDKTVKPDYMPAIQGLDDMLTFEHSTVAMVQIDLAQLKLSPTGELAVKIATTNTEDYAIEQDDFLKLGPGQWMKIDSTENGQAYMKLPEFVTVPGKSSLQVDFQRGMGSQGLLILVPTNVSTLGALQKDQQMLTARPSYLGQ